MTNSPPLCDKGLRQKFVSSNVKKVDKGKEPTIMIFGGAGVPYPIFFFFTNLLVMVKVGYTPNSKSSWLGGWNTPIMIITLHPVEFY